MPVARVEDALALAARGFRVFPLRVNDWRPAIKGWVEAATTSEVSIRAWWGRSDFNIGVATGQGLLVIDVDNKKGKNGSKSFADLDLPFEALDTFTVETPSGGRHVYFCGPDVGNSAGALDSGLDIRSGGGYVVGPGSSLSEGVKDGQPGGLYRVAVSATPRSAPADLLSRLRRAVPKLPNGNGKHDDAADVAAAIAYLSRDAQLAVEGKGGDHTTFAVSAHLKDLGVFEDAAFDLLVEHWNDRCQPPWELEDLRVKVANAYLYGENPPGSKSPEAAFEGVNVPPVEIVPRTPSRWLMHGTAFDRHGLWLVVDILPGTGVVVLVAPSQSGKTFLLLELARCIATGKPFFNVKPDEKGGTLIVFAGTEGSGLARRLAALGEAEKLPIAATVVGNLAEKDGLANLLLALQEKAAEMLIEFGVPVRLIILETVAASGLLIDENSNAEASRAISNLAQISVVMNALVVTSHHPAKGTGRSRGAGAITDNADYVLEIRREGRGSVRNVELVKARDAEQRALGSFTLLPVDLGKDDRGRTITSMSVSMGEPETRVERETKHAPLAMQSVEWAEASGTVVIDGKSCVNKMSVWLAFKDLCKSPKGESNVHKVYRTAMEYLEGQGVIEIIEQGKDLFVHRKEMFT